MYLIPQDENLSGLPKMNLSRLVFLFNNNFEDYHSNCMQQIDQLITLGLRIRDKAAALITSLRNCHDDIEGSFNSGVLDGYSQEFET